MKYSTRGDSGVSRLVARQVSKRVGPAPLGRGSRLFGGPPSALVQLANFVSFNRFGGWRTLGRAREPLG
jgi:hypothetical protein